MAKTGFENGSAYFGNQVSTRGTETSERITDGSFNNWTPIEHPNNFEVDNLGVHPEKSTDKYAGDYACKLETCFDIDGGTYVSSLITNEASANAGETIQAKIYGKYLAGDVNVAVYYAYPDGDDEVYYNFSGVNIGTWTIGGDGPSGDQMEILALTDSYTQKVFTTSAVVPAEKSGAVAVVTILGGSGKTAVLDNLEVLVDGVDAAVNGTFEAWTTVDYTPTDWDFGQVQPEGGGDDSTIEREEVIVDSGTYSVKFTINNDKGPYVAQLIESSGGSTVSLSYKARKSESLLDVNTEAFLYDDDPLTATKMWNFGGVNAGTWTDIGEGPGGDQKKTLALTDTFAADSFIVSYPATGKVYFWIVGRSASMPEPVYVDTCSAVESDGAIFEAESEANLADVVVGGAVWKLKMADAVVAYVLKDGSGKLGSLEWDADGAVTSGA